jgi:hypothetical protein
VQQTAQTMSDPADLIKVAIEQLIVARFELPGYSTLEEFANHLRHQVHQELYAQVTADLTATQKAILVGALAPRPADRFLWSDLAIQIVSGTDRPVLIVPMRE